MNHDTDHPESPFATLAEMLRRRAHEQPDLRVYTFLRDGERDEEPMTCRELHERAQAIAAALAQVEPGQRALLLYPPGLDYIAAFFGCLYAGVIAVPVYPPQHGRSLRRLQSIAGDAQATVGLLRAADQALLRQFLPMAPGLERLTWVATDALDPAVPSTSSPAGSDDVAFLQYTSGSTSEPKGVMLTHRNLLHNLDVIRRGFGHDRASRGVIWLPPYHDMGLIGGILQPLYVGFPVVLMSPLSFLQRPYRWLQAISRYQATTSGGPNFAYELCLRKIAPRERSELDLGSWRVAFNGAEPIRADTLERFSQAFAPQGFRREAFYPCYGLAEATLMVTGGHVERAPVTRAFDSAALQRGQAVPAEATEATGKRRTLVGLGHNLLGRDLVVVDPDTGAPRADREVGEIWVSGASVARGYWNQPEASERTFAAALAGARESGRDRERFLRTGDLGFMDAGELFMTGRAKDLIIIRGRNHYPQDIERTVEASHPAVRPGSGAAFTVEAGGSEELVIVYEISPRHAGDPDSLDAICEAIRRAVAQEHALAVHAIALLPPRTVPKTSSGKIQRYACREGYLSDELTALARFTAEDAAAAEDAAEDHTAPPTEGAGAVWSAVAQQVAHVIESASGTTARALPLERGADAPVALDSLATVELQHRLQRHVGVHVPLAELLRATRLSHIVSAVEAARGAQDANADANADAHAPDPIARGPETGAHPLSHGQRALWFLHQLAPDSRAYHIAAALRVTAPVDADALRRSLQHLVARHPALRTTFHTVAGEPRQRVHVGGDVAFTTGDLDALDDLALDEHLSRRAAEPFDLERGPLLRVDLYRLYRRGDHHVLLVVIHHLIADLWSLAVLARELSALYVAERDSAPVELPPPACHYTDAVRWQARTLAGPAGDRLWAYWQRELAGPAPILEQLADRARPPVQTYRGATLSRSLDADLTRRLMTLAEERGVTLFSVLLAAYGALLHRHNGQTEIWVGTPTAGRERAELAGVVGYFVNPVVVRVELDGDPAFATLLDQVSRHARDALAHAGMPFERLVEDLCPRRDPGRSPLFQTLFALQKAPLGSEHSDPGLASLALGHAGARMVLGGLPVESMALDLGAAQFDLSLSVAEVDTGGDTGLRASLEYNTDLFERRTAEALLERFAVLLQGVARDPARPVSALPLMTPEERARTARTQPGPAELPAPVPIHELIAAQVERSPDAAAVVHGARCLTYSELARRVHILARRLRALGVGPEVLVGLYVNRSPEQIIAVLGVLAAGGAYVPVDPEVGPSRLDSAVSDAGVRVIVCGPEHTALVQRHGVPVVEVAAELAGADTTPGQEPPGPAIHPDHLAYVIYTSGSTGRPKGVMIAHAALSTYVQTARAHYGITSADRVLQFASLSFDASVEEIFCGLVTGATLILRTPDMLDSADAFLAACQDQGVTVLCMPTAFWHTLAAAMDEHGLALPPAVHTVIIGGEAARADRLASWQRRVPARVRLLNTYGPTETTVTATCQDVHAGVGEGLDLLPIGLPLDTLTAHVLDSRLEPVPEGTVGELWLAGAGLARGYLGDPALTAQRFVPHPCAGEPGARLYRTGDRVRRRADGALLFLGRVDQQVKMRGFRVELGEIEAALRSYDSVDDAVVVAHAEPGGDPRLCAYVAARRPLALDRLRAHLGARLPGYMMPAALVELDALPRTASGKVDRRALPPPSSQDLAAGDDRAPRTPTEDIVAGIWADLLGLDRVGADRDFFELGGHSLLAMRAVARIRDALGVEVPVRTLFEERTVAGLAAWIDRARPGSDAAPDQAPDQAPPLAAVERSGPLPVSFAQQSLWLMARLSPDSSAYHVPGTLRLEGPLDVAALERSLADLIARHEVLRTGFIERDGVPVQVIEPAVPWSVPVDDLRALAPEDRAARARDLLAAERARPFDLTRPPLMRARLVRLDDHDHTLAITLHHIVCDGWSLSVLVRELGQLYAAHRDERPSPLPPLPLQYADYAAWQRGWLRGPALDRLIDAWRRRLDGAPPHIDLPVARAAPEQPWERPWERPCAAIVRVLPAPLVARLRGFARSRGATLFMTLCAGLDALIHRYTGRTDVIVASPMAQRTSAALESVVGFFVNTLPLRTDVSASPSFAELVARVRETTLAAYAHKEAPLETLIETLAPARTPGSVPYANIVFALQDAPSAAFDLPDLTATFTEELPAHAKFDLLLEVTDTGDTLTARWQYDAARFDAATIERLAEHFQILIDAAVARPARPITRIPLLTDTERHVLATANHTLRGYPRDRTLSELFLAQVERDPDAVALSQGSRTLTYGELAGRAHQLARALRARGLGPGHTVGIYLPRSFEAIIAILGTIEAGAAYLPLTPGDPAERLALVLDDAGASVVLTDETLAPSIADLAIAGLATTCLCLDRDGPSIAQQPADPVPPAGTADHPAYIMYTSGSTGRPKGVSVPHRAVVRLVARPNYLTLGPDQVLLQLAPLAFDASTLEIWGALLSGARLALAPAEAPGLAELGRLLVAEGVTTLWLTAGLFHALVDHIDSMDPTEGDPLAGVRQLLAGGDVLSPGHVARVLESHPQLTLINGYGPTENTTFTCCHPMAMAMAMAMAMTAATPPAAQAGAPVPIGAPITGTRVYILDDHLAPVPIGVPGELYCAGDGLAHGYVGQPALTAARFVPDPFSDAPGARMYRTGDRARWRMDGRVEFLGRADRQIKVRGFRIEPGEVEAALAAHPAVRDALVMTGHEDAHEKRLIAHVILDAPDAATSRALRAFVGAKLPAHMVPDLIAVHRAFPLTRNGKVDRAALARMTQAEPDPAKPLSVPRTSLEATLAALWCQVLRRPRVGIHDDFFELGGHSLLATQLVSRVHAATGVELPVRALFEAPTIAGQAARIDAARQDQPAVTAHPLTPVARDHAMPLSFAQQRLWLIAQLDPDSPAYNIPGALELTGALDVAVLERCLRAIVARHEVLRTGFVARDGAPVQVIAPEVELPLPVDDLSGRSSEEAAPDARDQRARELARAEASRPFDLHRPPLMRARLIRLDPRRHVLVLTLHHIVADGWSLGVLFREMSALYQAFTAGRPSPLEPLPVQYADYAAWQRRWLQGDLLDAQLGYWRRQLAGAPPELPMPADRPRPPVQTYRGATVDHTLDPALAAELTRRGREHNATLYMTALAGFVSLLHQLTGAQDMVVGTPIANRTQPRTEGLIGFFANTLALRCQVHAGTRFCDLLGHVRAVTLDAYEHQDVPFERVVDELGIERSSSRVPLVQILFVLQNAPVPALELGDLTLSLVDLNVDTVKFDLVVILRESDRGLHIAWNYSTDLFDRATIERLHRQYERVLRQVIATPDMLVSQIDPRTDSERQQHERATRQRRSADFARLTRTRPRPISMPVPPNDDE